ncbi:MAG: DUF1611 domain-containing protein [Gammaproteobacteria bacterium]|nr:DUF1611 domain-containing protein [Gammaproteobacteria bacterium]MDH3467320.1 DUF1611 domain-containing protein [Gammaproteobacteria bacterium]
MHDGITGAAVVIANGHYQTPDAKVSHGLVRGSDRFRVRAVIDPDCAGADAGFALDSIHRDIPVVAELADALRCAAEPLDYAIIGVATHGGALTPDIKRVVASAIDAGLGIINGLHDLVGDDVDLATSARRRGVAIVDLRRPRPARELHFWSGAIRGVRTPRVAVLGTDCALGKRTTTRLLTGALRASGIRAEMIYTGQTGWMQGARYGFILDSTLNDFVSGELEHAVLECERGSKPDVMLLEGQSSLRNPTGPCGAELLLSGGASGVVLQHAPRRRFFDGDSEPIPPLASEIALIAAYGVDTLAVTLNTDGMADDTRQTEAHRLRVELGIPVLCPLEDGIDELVGLVRDHIDKPL